MNLINDLDIIAINVSKKSLWFGSILIFFVISKNELLRIVKAFELDYM